MFILYDPLIFSKAWIDAEKYATPQSNVDQRLPNSRVFSERPADTIDEIYTALYIYNANRDGSFKSRICAICVGAHDICTLRFLI